MGRDEPLALALRALRRRERSVAELGEWLRERGVDDEEVEVTVTRLAEAGELDDARFARRYAEDKRQLAGWGSERIREALVARGVDPDLIEAAVADGEGDDELDRAIALLDRRTGPLESEAARARALGYLTRRGYAYEVAYEAVRAHERAA